MEPQQDFRKPFSDDALLRRNLVVESNAALCVAALGVIAYIAVASVLLAVSRGREHEGVRASWHLFPVVLGVCTALGLLAFLEQVRGWVAYAILVPFASLPTIFFLSCHVLLPVEAAAYVQGPLSYLYFVTLAVAGLSLDVWVTSVSSVVAAVGFECCRLLTRAGASSDTSPDAWSLLELIDPSSSGFKSLMILAGGLVVAAGAGVARRLVRQVLDEARVENVLGRLFGEYIREEAKTRLLYQPRAQVGERKQVAVLVAELRGFDEHSRTTGPQELVDQLNAYFEAMVQSITLRGGAIDRFTGDSLLATFGGMVALDSPCALALEAAREMRVRLDLLNSRWQVRGRAMLDNDIGLHVGEVVLGQLGSALHRDFTLVGQPVSTASRVGSIPREPGYPILLTGAFYEQLPPSQKSTCRRLGTAQVKGHRAPMELYGIPEGPIAAPVRVARDTPHPRDTTVTWE